MYEKLLKKALIDKNLNYSTLAKKLNVSNQLISQIVRGVNKSKRVRKLIEAELEIKIWNIPIGDNTPLSSNNNISSKESRERETVDVVNTTADVLQPTVKNNQNTRELANIRPITSSLGPHDQKTSVNHRVIDHFLKLCRETIPMFETPNATHILQWHQILEKMFQKGISEFDIMRTIDFAFGDTDFWKGIIKDFKKFQSKYSDIWAKMNRTQSNRRVFSDTNNEGLPNTDITIY